MASQSQDIFQPQNMAGNSEDSQNTIACVEGKSELIQQSHGVMDSGIELSLAGPSTTEIGGGAFNQCQIGDQTQNFYRTRNDTRVLNQIENSNYISQGPENKRPRIASEDATQKQRTGKLQLLNSIEADLSERLHKSKRIYKGEKKTAIGPIPVAVKILDVTMSKKEVENLHKVDCHPNVVRIYDSNVHWEGEIEYIYIAMELCSTETLNDYVKRRGEQYDLQLAISHSTQLIRGLRYIHDRGICHHDVKPHNTLFALKEDGSISYDNVKMTDFGFSKRFQTEASVTRSTYQGAGTKGYMAPEVLDFMEKQDLAEKKEAEKKIGFKIDVFSVALVICFCLGKGHHPYGPTTNQQDANIEAGREPDLSQIQISENIEWNMKELLKEMLQYNPEDRPTMAEVWEEWQSLMSVLGRAEEVCQVAPPGIPDVHQEAEDGIKVPRPSIILFESSSKDGKICSVYSFQPGNEAKEIEIAPLPASVSTQTHTAVAVGQKLYALTWMKYVFVLDMEDLYAGWKDVYSTEHLHGRYPPAVVFEDKIYACGGGWYSKSQSTFSLTGEPFPVASSACEVYDPIEGRWKNIAHMREERGQNSIVLLGEHLYSIGGWNANRKPLKSVEKLDPKSGVWQYTAEMNKVSCYISASTLGNKIYVLGGEAQHIETYCPDSNIWTLLSFKLSPDEKFRYAVTLGGKLYAVGGREVLLVDIEHEECRKQCGLEWKLNSKATIALN